MAPQPATKPIRRLRKLTRYRTAMLGQRTRAKQRLEKILEDAGIKLSSVATGILGVSGRAMLAALAAGVDDPAATAKLAKGAPALQHPRARRRAARALRGV